ncbi:dienelactone hydrolase domain-containing protein [Purpureocillium lavendulum]|uniref:Dienelactone hydrolase domain-containing protein n=1 Tax=Purpureocillium lavendulum TaxID=1247861 RepID=A0AB34FK25_9HYPO|nr:dienelactone hydrolase domain-containing protein [Purpureocillium lavendulum]
MRQDVKFNSQGLTIVGHLYVPGHLAGNERVPAVVVSHPGGGVKEQTAGLYARQLNEQGFVTLAFDCAYHGESEGTPRGLEDPAHRVEDIKSAVTFLAGHERVDTSRIGLLGICASGGYAVTAAATDIRIKAVATVSGVDLGSFIRKGYNGKQDPSVLKMQLEHAAVARTASAGSAEAQTFPLFPPDEATARQLGPYVYEGWDYYATPRGHHPRSAKEMPWMSIDKLAGFYGFASIDQISPRPLLMIAGAEAETKWMAMEALQAAKEPKELFLIEGASHVDLYDREDYVGQATQKLTGYYRQWLTK